MAAERAQASSGATAPIEPRIVDTTVPALHGPCSPTPCPRPGCSRQASLAPYPAGCLERTRLDVLLIRCSCPTRLAWRVLS